MKKRIVLAVIYVLGIMVGHSQTQTIKQYIDSFKHIAMIEMVEYKIPASITLAQGLLESGSGNSRLAKQGNNHFGIKCKKDWTGCTILEADDALQECFRCYKTAEESYKDHSRFLKENKRYAALFQLSITDYKGWAAGLLAAGYATNQKYSELLIRTIEKNGLTAYDSMIVNGYNRYNKVVPAKISIVDNKVPSTVVQPNQTVGSIAEANDKTAKKIRKYNDLSYHQQIEPGDVLYLKPKKRKASVESHQVSEGETMWDISQKYAIKINSLYKKNLMLPGTEPKTGVVLQLQHKADSRPDNGRASISVPVGENEYHIVGAVETLYSISRIYGIKVEDLISMNGIVNNQIKPGQRLLVKKTQAESKSVKHTVQAGETLYSISKRYNVTVASIKAANGLSSDSLQVGKVLDI